LLDALDVAHRHQRPHQPHGQHWPGADHLVGKRLDPALDRRLLPAPLQVRNGELHQCGGTVDVAGGHGVVHRRRRLPLFLVPPARAQVQVGDLVATLVVQMGAQHVGEEVVVPVPPAVVVERHHEQVGALQ
jgi:hypothetical protein